MVHLDFLVLPVSVLTQKARRYSHERVNGIRLGEPSVDLFYFFHRGQLRPRRTTNDGRRKVGTCALRVPSAVLAAISGWS